MKEKTGIKVRFVLESKISCETRYKNVKKYQAKSAIIKGKTGVESPDI